MTTWKVWLSRIALGVASLLAGGLTAKAISEGYRRFKPIDYVLCDGDIAELSRRKSAGWRPGQMLTQFKANELTVLFGPNCNSSALQILLRSGVDPNLSDPYGRLPISSAAGALDFGAVSTLVAFGVDVNRRGSDGRTALMMLVNPDKGTLHMARFLVALGADVTLLDPGGRPAWSGAERISGGRARELVDFLKAEAGKSGR